MNLSVILCSKSLSGQKSLILCILSPDDQFISLSVTLCDRREKVFFLISLSFWQSCSLSALLV